MEEVQLTISLTDGRLLQARPRPEDEPRLAELLGDRSTIELSSNDDDLEGHALTGDVVVDVEGHAVSIRLPNAADAAALRKALAVGAVTATLVGAGAIAALQPQAAAPTTVVPAPAADNVREAPAPAVRAQQAEAAQQFTVVVPPQAVPLDADNPAVPAPALRAGQADAQQGQQVQAAPLLDATNPAVPAPAVRAQGAEDAQQGSQTVLTDATNPAVPAPALRSNGE
jgi:hypothetical protein